MSSEISFRFRPVWVALGWALVLAVVYLSLARDVPELAVPHGDKYGHVVAYATLMLWFSQLHAARHARAWLALAFVALGVGLEFVQGLTDYRSFELADMVADGIGVACGWLAAPPRLPNFLLWADARVRAGPPT